MRWWGCWFLRSFSGWVGDFRITLGSGILETADFLWIVVLCYL